MTQNWLAMFFHLEIYFNEEIFIPGRVWLSRISEHSDISKDQSRTFT